MACAIVKLSGGATIFLEVSWASYIEKEKIYLNLYGTEGGAELYPLRIFADEERTPLTITPDLSRIKKSTSMEYFIDCISQDIQPTVATIENGVKLMRIVNAIYESATKNREVHL